MIYGAMNSPLLRVTDEIKVFAEMGFDYFELTMDPPCAHFSTIRRKKDEILNALEKCGMALVCHLPTFVYMADLTESIRKASVDETLNSLSVAAELGAPKVVLHPGIPSGLGGLVIDESKKLALESLETIMEHAEKLGVRICLENMYPKCGLFYEPDHFADVFEQYPILEMTLDIGHANIFSGRKKRAFEFIRRFGGRIGHVHISDNKGKRDDHIPIGSGNIDFDKVIRTLKEIGYTDTVTFEIFTEDRKFLMSSRKRFHALANA